MDFDAVPVVDVDVLLLRHGKELVVVQPLDVSNRLAQLNLTAQLSFPPVHRRDMALPPTEQQLSSVA
jgi:hypothetical protein